MPYVIMFVDDPGVIEKKKRVRPVHLEYVLKNAHRIITSGGLFPDDADFPNGGLIILDTDMRQDAIDYIENDPFYLNGIFSTYTVSRWRKFIFDYKPISS
ncbi:MAG TPA: YciI family protein [Candidatus Acidoferrales bacterium]|nr:YciI family protein [Candidatus Acidoferrales bacterium]